MSLIRKATGLTATLAAVAVLLPRQGLACAACYGQSDAPMAHGMNWGILSLLAIISMVLIGVASFFVFLSRRAAAFRPTQVTGVMAGATERV